MKRTDTVSQWRYRFLPVSSCPLLIIISSICYLYLRLNTWPFWTIWSPTICLEVRKKVACYRDFWKNRFVGYMYQFIQACTYVYLVKLEHMVDISCHFWVTSETVLKDVCSVGICIAISVSKSSKIAQIATEKGFICRKTLYIVHESCWLRRGH